MKCIETKIGKVANGLGEKSPNGRKPLKGPLGGRGGIRTHERCEPLPVFKTGALNHSATLPSLTYQALNKHVGRTKAEIATGIATAPRSDAGQRRIHHLCGPIIGIRKQMPVNIECDLG